MRLKKDAHWLAPVRYYTHPTRLRETLGQTQDSLDNISQLAWECLEIPQEQLEFVDGDREPGPSQPVAIATPPGKA